MHQSLKNKNKHIVHYERKRMVFGFMGFAQLGTPGQIIDLKLRKILKFSLEGHVKKFYDKWHQKTSMFLVLQI